MSTVSILEKKSFSKFMISGIIAGLGGGIVFGMMMAMMGMLPMVGALVGQANGIVGFIVHMIISAIIGTVFGLALNLGNFRLTWGFAIISGMVNGIVWWVLGALILMPLGLGMNDIVLKIGGDQWLSLMGHLIFGVVTGLLFVLLIRRKN